jgi:hypothetical protein
LNAAPLGEHRHARGIDVAESSAGTLRSRGFYRPPMRPCLRGRKGG